MVGRVKMKKELKILEFLFRFPKYDFNFYI